MLSRQLDNLHRPVLSQVHVRRFYTPTGPSFGLYYTLFHLCLARMNRNVRPLIRKESSSGNDIIPNTTHHATEAEIC